MSSSENLSPYFGAADLMAASQPVKIEMLSQLITGLQNEEIRAGNTAFELTGEVFNLDHSTPVYNISHETEASHGTLPAIMSLRLVKTAPRVKGFLDAIERWPQQEGVIDVGTGTFPVLALAAALYHPTAEVTAVEINPQSANVAHKIVDMFGLNDRLHVVNSDIVKYTPDANTTAAVTETFNAGLQNEPGPKIVQLLHKDGIPLITPSIAQLRLNILKEEFFQVVDLRTDTHAEIGYVKPDFVNKNMLVGRVNVQAAYFDEHGLVLDYDTDQISSGLAIHQASLVIGQIAAGDTSGRLAYELGTYPFEPRVEALETAAA